MLLKVLLQCQGRDVDACGPRQSALTPRVVLQSTPLQRRPRLFEVGSGLPINIDSVYEHQSRQGCAVFVSTGLCADCSVFLRHLV